MGGAEVIHWYLTDLLLHLDDFRTLPRNTCSYQFSINSVGSILWSTAFTACAPMKPFILTYARF